MKNHVIVDGQLLQTNKKWAALKESQKGKICNWLKAATAEYFQDNGEYPAHHANGVVVDMVFSKIQEANIWIPYEEVYNYYSRKKRQIISKLMKAEERNAEPSDAL